MIGNTHKKYTIHGTEREQKMELRNYSKKKIELRVYGYDNFEGDKGIIIASNYDEAVRVYREIYERKITDDHSEYMEDSCYLFDMGVVEENRMYVNAEW